VTRIAVLADIHANADALEAVLHHADAEGASELVVLGDVIGYYYQPLRVLELLDPWEKRVIRGNHEDLLGKWLEGDADVRESLRKRYGRGFALCEETLPSAATAWLMRLPHPEFSVMADRRVGFCHGHPNDIDAYVYPNLVDRLIRDEETTRADVLWLGHTHYPMLERVASTRVWNPGSVGQPRDRDPRAAYAMLNLDTGSLTAHRVEYNIVTTQRQMATANLPDVLIGRLAHGV